MRPLLHAHGSGAWIYVGTSSTADSINKAHGPETEKLSALCSNNLLVNRFPPSTRHWAVQKSIYYIILYSRHPTTACLDNSGQRSGSKNRDMQNRPEQNTYIFLHLVIGGQCGKTVRADQGFDRNLRVCIGTILHSSHLESSAYCLWRLA